MNAQSLAGVVLGLSIIACGAPAADPSEPEVTLALEASGSSADAPRSGELSVSGRLEGELYGMELATETTANVGSFQLWESGGSNVQLSIAANASPSGAGMLIVSFLGTAMEDVLESGTWSSTVDASSPVTGASTVVTSCAGPEIGDWPYELPATSAEITVTEVPEQPGTVVLLVNGRFPSELGTDETTELAGTFRFERFD